jgi:hypothetical protein
MQPIAFVVDEGPEIDTIVLREIAEKVKRPDFVPLVRREWETVAKE